MKLSQFNLAEESQTGGLLLYNTLTGGVLSLNAGYAAQYRSLMTGGDSCASPELIGNLKRASMLVDEGLDEVQQLRVLHLMQRFGSPAVSVTIAPTLECNFACPYCYEKGRRCHSMARETAEQCVSFLKQAMQGHTSLGIAWYGGEPLLEMDTITGITQALLKEGYPLTAAITTNGYLLTRETAQRLKENQVRNVQITLDGSRELHNARRYLLDGGGTFDRILANLAAAWDVLPITIRVNVDKENIRGVASLLDELDAHGLKGKVSLYLAPVDNVNNTCHSSVCFTDREFAEAELHFYKEQGERGYFNVRVPGCNPGLCGAVSASSYLVDPKGSLYQCWDDIGDLSQCVGTLSDGPGHLSPGRVDWLSYEFADEECHKCPILPVCMGGCPNGYRKKHSRFCHAMKYHAKEYLQLLARQKQGRKDADAPC